MKRTIGLAVLLVILYLYAIQSGFVERSNDTVITEESYPTEIVEVAEVVETAPSPQLRTPPPQKALLNTYHIFQTFNNCGPAAMSMALSYYGINESQQTLGQKLRPYQNQLGDNDDKSVTLEEIAELSKEYGLTPFRRPNGTIETIEKFISYDVPVLARTRLKPDDDIGHYRVIKGYSQNTQEILQDDSLQGQNLRYSYKDFNELWKFYGYEYLVLVPKDKIEVALLILGEDSNEQTSWERAVKNYLVELSDDPDDVYTRFNLSIALYNTGDYARSVEEFEKIEHQLSFRTLWYQIEPIQAYFELGQYDRVFEISDKILSNQNRAFSELYLLRGNIYLNQNKPDLARAEFEKAVLCNSSMVEAKEALSVL